MLILQLIFESLISIKIAHLAMQSEETFLVKNFSITNEQTGVTVQTRVNVPYLPASRELNFSRALSFIYTNGVNLSNSQVFYLDLHKRMRVFIGQYPFHQEILLKQQLFPQDTVQIHYRKLVIQGHVSQQPCPPQPKKRKVKQRAIKEAIDAVKQWRQLYQITDLKGKRVYTLETAAQKVGFAKKTLDDYFNQLRLAQHHCFNFSRHQFDKIGVLRRFVRSCKKKQQDLSSMSVQEQDSNNANNDHQDIDKYLKDPSSFDDEDKLF